MAEFNKKIILKKLEDGQITAKEAFNMIKNNEKNNKDNSNNKYYSITWQNTNIDLKDIRINEKFHIILFANDSDMSNSLVQRFKEQGSKVTIVKKGESYREIDEDSYEIKPEVIEDYKKLINSLKQKGLTSIKIIFAWGSSQFKDSINEIEKYLNESIYASFNIVKTMMGSKGIDESCILYMYKDEKNYGLPQYSALNGFAKTLAIENSKFIYKVIEVSDSSEEDIFKIALAELDRKNTEETEIVYKNKQRLVKNLEECTFKKHDNSELPLKEKGVYLITGGTGGLGLIFAKYLAKKVRANLILTGRSPINDKKRKSIEELEALGSKVVYIKSDVTKYDDVEEAIEQGKKHFGTINGVIQSAGLISDSIILNKKKGDIEKVIKPKVLGTIWLEKATRNEKLDIFITFSSVSSLMGNAGQCDYAYGNSFIDNFVKMRINKNTYGKSLSLNWPLWEEGGMRPDANTIAWMKETMGLAPLSTQTGIETFEKGLNSEYSQIMVVTMTEKNNQQNLKEELEVNIDDVDIDEKQLYEKTQMYLKKILSNQIGLSEYRIEENEPLESYGIDSVMIMSLTTELEKEFGELSKTLFYENQTISQLTEYFIENQYNKLIKKFRKELKISSGNKKETNKTAMKRSMNIESQPRRSRNRFIDTSERKENNNYSREDIAVIGLSGKYPMAKDIDEFWRNLKNGKDCITEIPKDRWDYSDIYDSDKGKEGKINSKWGGFLDDVDKFDPLFFNISPQQSEFMDPQERLFLETAWQTLEDGGYTRKSLDKYTVGVFVGVMYGHYQLFGAEESAKGNLMALSSSFASIANRVSYYFNFDGPSIALDTMCSSSLTAIHLACGSIHKGESDYAIAGGVNLSLHQNKYILLSQGGFMSSDGRCRSFGASGDGYVPGEGVGAILLKPLSKAIKDGDQIYAVIKGTSVNHGGKTNGYTVPNPNKQAEVIKKTLDKTKIDPKTITYIETHGTGTALGDPIEITGLEKAFKKNIQEKHFCSIGSVKSNVGHLESAAGIAGVTKILLQMKYKQLVPSLHSETLNPNINFTNSPFYVQQELSEWRQPTLIKNGVEKKYPLRAGISSFGAGGANAHIIFEEYEKTNVNASSQRKEKQIIMLSAKNPERLKAYGIKLATYLKKHTKDRQENHTDKAKLIKELEKDLVNNLAFVFDVAKADIDKEESINEYGLDDVILMNFINNINKKYILNISNEVLLEYSSVKDLAQYLYMKYKSKLIKHYDLLSKNSEKEDSSKEIRLEDIAYTLQVGREKMEEKVALIVSSIDDLIKKLILLYKGNSEISGVYRSMNTNIDSLFTDSQGKSFINQIIQNRDLKKIAQLWVSGVKIDYKLLYSNTNPRRISLPTYPFARERYWIPDLKGNAAKGFNNNSQAVKNFKFSNTKSHSTESQNEEYYSNTVEDYVASTFDVSTSMSVEERVIEEIKQIFAGQLKISEELIKDDNDLMEYGFDSLIGMRIVNELKDYYGKEISVKEFLSYTTIRDMANYLIEANIVEYKEESSVELIKRVNDVEDDINSLELTDNDINYINLLERLQNINSSEKKEFYRIILEEVRGGRITAKQATDIEKHLADI